MYPFTSRESIRTDEMKSTIDIYCFKLVMRGKVSESEDSPLEDIQLNDLIERVLVNDGDLAEINEERNNENSMLFKS